MIPGPSSGTALRRSVLFCYALPGVAQAFLLTPVQTLLQGIYTKHAGVALGAIGLALVLVRVWDAAVDPFIGFLCDRTAARSGTRKPWILAGTIVMGLGIWFLFRPPAGVGARYFALWYLVASLGWSFVEVAWRAWGVELTRDYLQRNRMQVWCGMLAAVAAIGFYLLPPVGKALGLTDSTELDLTSLGMAAVVMVVLVPPMTLLSLWKVPDGEIEPAPAVESWRSVRRSLVENEPLLRFAAAVATISLAAGIYMGTNYLMVDVYFGLSKQLAFLLAATIPVTFLAIPLWGWICARFERHRAWAIAIVVTALAQVGATFLPRGEAALIPIGIASLVVAAAFVGSLVVAPAMIGDIADYGRHKFRQDRAGLYIACYGLMSKTIIGIASGVGLILLGWLGFEATAQAQTAKGVFAIRLVGGWLPGLLLLGAAPLLWRYPLTRARHAQIAAELAARANAAGVRPALDLADVEARLGPPGPS